MTDKTYNGWTNYETWNVALWMDNDQGAYEMWKERAEDAVKRHEDDHDTPEEIRDAAAADLAEEIESQHKDEENLPDLSGAYGDLLMAALGEVNWREIAEHLVADVEIEEADASE